MSDVVEGRGGFTDGWAVPTRLRSSGDAATKGYGKPTIDDDDNQDNNKMYDDNQDND